jgi:hypothetical protein
VFVSAFAPVHQTRQLAPGAPPIPNFGKLSTLLGRIDLLLAESAIATAWFVLMVNKQLSVYLDNQRE